MAQNRLDEPSLQLLPRARKQRLENGSPPFDAQFVMANAPLTLQKIERFLCVLGYAVNITGSLDYFAAFFGAKVLPIFAMFPPHLSSAVDAAILEVIAPMLSAGGEAFALYVTDLPAPFPKLVSTAQADILLRTAEAAASKIRGMVDIIQKSTNLAKAAASLPSGFAVPGWPPSPAPAPAPAPGGGDGKSDGKRKKKPKVDPAAAAATAAATAAAAAIVNSAAAAAGGTRPVQTPGGLASNVTLNGDEITIKIPGRPSVPARGNRPERKALNERTLKFSVPTIAAAAGVPPTPTCWPVAAIAAISNEKFANQFCPCSADAAHQTPNTDAHEPVPSLTKAIVAQYFSSAAQGGAP